MKCRDPEGELSAFGAHLHEPKYVSLGHCHCQLPTESRLPALGLLCVGCGGQNESPCPQGTHAPEGAGGGQAITTMSK